MTTDYPDYATPQAHATAIFNTQVPLAGKPMLLLFNANVNLPHGALTEVDGGVTGFFTTLYLSYNIALILTPGAGSTFPFCRLTLIMLNPDGSEATQEHWVIPMMAPYTKTPVIGGDGRPQGVGRIVGGIMKVFIKNLDTVDATLNGIDINGDSRTSPLISSIQDNPGSRTYPGTAPFVAPPEGGGFDRVLGASLTNTLAPGTTVHYLLGLYAGKVTFDFQATGGTAGNIQWTLKYVNGSVGGVGNYGVIATGTSGAGAQFGPTEFDIPRAPLVLDVTSTEGATTDTLIWACIAAGDTH